MPNKHEPAQIVDVDSGKVVSQLQVDSDFHHHSSVVFELPDMGTNVLDDLASNISNKSPVAAA